MDQIEMKTQDLGPCMGRQTPQLKEYPSQTTTRIANLESNQSSAQLSHLNNPLHCKVKKSTAKRKTPLRNIISLRRRSYIRYNATWVFILLSLAYCGKNDLASHMSYPIQTNGSSFFVLAASRNTDEAQKENEKQRNSSPSPHRSFIPNSTSQNKVPSIERLKRGLRLHGGHSKQEVIPPPPQMTLSQILAKAGKRGLGGGIPGAIAGVVQVLSLMWLRTIMNYQCRYGTSFRQAIVTLYNQGGVPRFYRGLSFALIQAPLSRFVSTAANDGVETLLTNLKLTEGWGPGRTTFIASFVVGMWRMVLMPIDTCKTVLQVDSAEGFRNLMRKVKAGKVNVLYEGALANAVSAVVSHYPWFYTYNYLSRSSFIENLFQNNLLRNAGIGLLSSIVSDTIANVVRVVKTTKQSYAAKHSVGYWEVISMIHAADGWKGLFGRGLRTRILGNAVQSIIFTVMWRGLAERLNGNSDGDNNRQEQERRNLKKRKEEDSNEGYADEIKGNFDQY